MQRKVLITPFNPSFLDIFQKYKQLLSPLNVTLELIGSAAVPMACKQEIDVLIICNDVKSTHEELAQLLGHAVGPMVSGVGYAKDRRFGIVAEFHVVHVDSSYIDYQRSVVRFLQENPEKRKQLAELKFSLNGKTHEEYKQGKDSFMKSLFD